MRERTACILADTLEEYLHEDEIYSFKYESDSLLKHISRLTISKPETKQIKIISDNLAFGKKYFMKRKNHNIKLKILKFKGHSLGFRGKINEKK